MLQKEENLLLERNFFQQQSNTSLPAAPVSSEVKVTIMTDTAEEVGIATAAVPLSYSQRDSGGEGTTDYTRVRAQTSHG
jgi:hypothetical protein